MSQDPETCPSEKTTSPVPLKPVPSIFSTCGLLTALALLPCGCAGGQTVADRSSASPWHPHSPMRPQARKQAPVSRPMKTPHQLPATARLGDGMWTTYDGEEFPYRSWLPKNGQPPESVIVAVHGLSGAADDFRPLGQYFEEKQTAVYSYELRGQGNDPRERRRGDIGTAEQWYRDLDAFLTLVRREHPGVPVFVYGESLGALILMNGLTSLSPDNFAAIEGVAMGSPIVALRQKLPPFQDLVVHLLIRITPWLKVSLEKLGGSKPVQVTSTTTHQGQMAVTPHYIEHFTFRLLGAIEKMIHNCPGGTCAIGKPLILFYPGQDVFTAAEDVDAFFKDLTLPQKEKHFYPDGFHLLLHDTSADDILKKLEAWMEREAKAGPKAGKEPKA